MPSRVIRGDDILESDRVMTLPDRLQALYFKLLCAADGYGLYSLAPRQLARVYGKTPTPGAVERDISALVSRDLVRKYGDNTVGWFIFLPRYGQRLRAYTSRCALPPAHLYADDKDAEKLFNDNKHLFKKVATSGGGLSASGGGSRPDVDVEVEVEGNKEVEASEMLKSAAPILGNATASASPQPPADARSTPILKNLNVKNGSKGPMAWASELGLRPQRPDEAISDYIAFVNLEVSKHQEARQ